MDGEVIEGRVLDSSTLTSETEVVKVELESTGWMPTVRRVSALEIDYVTLTEGGGRIVDFPHRSSAQPDSAKVGWSTRECAKNGRLDAETVGTTGAFFGGLAGGTVLGLLGALIATSVQDGPEPSVHAALSVPAGDCRDAYVGAYKQRGKSRKRDAALGGGILGSAVLAVAIIAN
jgi:hypothetical protein